MYLPDKLTHKVTRVSHVLDSIFLWKKNTAPLKTLTFSPEEHYMFSIFWISPSSFIHLQQKNPYHFPIFTIFILSNQHDSSSTPPLSITQKSLSPFFFTLHHTEPHNTLSSTLNPLSPNLKRKLKIKKPNSPNQNFF